MAKFFHRHAGAKFFMPNGQELAFAGGELDTDVLFAHQPDVKKAVETELNKIANVPSSMIYTKEMVADSSEAAVVGEIMDSATSGFDTVNHVPPGTKTHAIPMSPQSKPVIGAEASVVEKAAEKSAGAGTQSTQHHTQPQGSAAAAVAAARAAIAASEAASKKAQATNGVSTIHQPDLVKKG